jgi:hypothetical protein
MKLALALFLALVAPAEAACDLVPAAAPAVGLTLPGVARGPATAQEVAEQTAFAVAHVHAPVSPRYIDLPRAFAYFEIGGVRHGTIAAVLDGEMPAPGEAVTLVSRRRDPDLPCAFIPWTLVKGPPGKPVS